MKNIVRSGFIAASLMVCAKLSLAQVSFYGSDDFNDNTFASDRWTSGGGVLTAGGGTGSFTEVNGRFEASAAIATGNTNYGIYRYWSNSTTGNTSYNDSWQATVQVSIDASALPSSPTPNSRGGSIRLGMEVGMAGSSSGFMTIYLGVANLGYNVGSGSGTWNGTTYTGSSETFTGGFGNYGPTNNVLLRLEHDAATHELSSSYSFDQGATFVDLRSDNTSTWLTTPDTGFSLSLFTTMIRYGNPALDYTVNSGQAYLENFSVAAIPEPSTYAAMVGGAALGLAVWRKRRASLTARL